MVLIIRPAALVAAPQFTGAELDELSDRFTSSHSIYLGDILELIMKHTTLEPLYIILSEIVICLNGDIILPIIQPRGTRFLILTNRSF